MKVTQSCPTLNNPTPALLSGKSYGQRSLVGCSPWGHQELDMTEHAGTSPSEPLAAPRAGIFGVHLASVSLSLSPGVRRTCFSQSCLVASGRNRFCSLGGVGSEQWNTKGDSQNGNRRAVRFAPWPHANSLPSCHRFKGPGEGGSASTQDGLSHTSMGSWED